MLNRLPSVTEAGAESPAQTVTSLINQLEEMLGTFHQCVEDRAREAADRLSGSVVPMETVKGYAGPITAATSNSPIAPTVTSQLRYLISSYQMAIQRTADHLERVLVQLG